MHDIQNALFQAVGYSRQTTVHAELSRKEKEEHINCISDDDRDQRRIKKTSTKALRRQNKPQEV